VAVEVGNVAVWSFVLDSQDRIFRLSQAFYARLVDEPAVHRVPRFAGQRVRLVQASVDAARGRVAQVQHMIYTWLSFDSAGRLDPDSMKREAAEVMDSLLASSKSNARKLQWRPRKSLESLLRRAAQGEDAVPDLSAKVEIADSPAVPLLRRSVESLLREQQELADANHAFDPQDAEDARRRVFQGIVSRRGQSALRQVLLKAYSGRCAVSGCDLADALEAAHLFHYRGEQTNQVANGLLLRADLHTLFDLGLMSVEPKSRRIAIHSSLENSPYAEFKGVAIFTPRRAADRPSEDALQLHWQASRVHQDGDASSI
jgi:hypothetical protein